MKNETGTPNKIQDMLPMSLDAGWINVSVNWMYPSPLAMHCYIC
jgi:hypothetical protein